MQRSCTRTWIAGLVLLGTGLCANPPDAVRVSAGPRPDSGAARYSHVMAVPAAVDDQGAPVALCLPFVLQPLVRGIPDPSASATPIAPTRTASATPTPSPTATASPTASPTPRPLERRISQRVVPLDARIAREMGTWTSYPIVSAPRYDGSQLVGWSTVSGQVRITPLDAHRAREAADLSFAGESVHGLVAHPDGGAALYKRGDEMRLRRFDSAGQVVFEQALVGTGGHGADGDKWIDDWSHEGRLAWTGQVYAAYFGHTQNWGSRGNHQGDLLWLFDGDGRRISGQSVPGYYPEWDWGCSHSIDVRLTYNAVSDTVGPVCLSDEHPRDGVIWSRSTLIASMPGDGGGHVEGQLGGLVTSDRGFSLTYVSRTGRSSYDVALSSISESGHPTSDVWLTDTSGANETSAHLASYGHDLLAAWRSGGQLLLSVVDLDGALEDGPLAVDAGIGERDDFFNYPDGRVGWTYASSDRSSLVTVVVELP